MAFPIALAALGAGAAYLLLSKKPAAAAPGLGGSPSAGTGSTPYSAPSSSYVAPSTTPSSDGSLSPGTPYDGGTILGPSSYSDTSTTPGGDLGGAASATGTNADSGSFFDNFTTSGPPLVWCEAYGAWCPYYAGYELGYPPPRGTPLFS
jgi:hypothetical protein